MRLVVTDTNVFIDLMSVDALEEFFALGLEVHTTAFVLEELVEEQGRLLLPMLGAGRLRVAQFTGEEVAAIEVMRTKVKIEFTDRSVVHLALQLEAMVLSGDGNLWKECRSRRLEVHGSIWVMEQLWTRRLIGPVSCIERLEALKRLNGRLPKSKVDELIERIRKG